MPCVSAIASSTLSVYSVVEEDRVRERKTGQQLYETCQ